MAATFVQAPVPVGQVGWVSARVRAILGIDAAPGSAAGSRKRKAPSSSSPSSSSSSSSADPMVVDEGGDGSSTGHLPGDDAGRAKAPRRLPQPASKVADFRIRGAWGGQEYHYGIGSAVFVISPHHPGCVLLGKRKGSDGAGTWAVPGGHLAYGEDLLEAAMRELEEETGLTGRNARVGCWHNAVDPGNNYHYIIPFVVCEVDGEPVNKEPDKCEGWFWLEWAEKGGAGCGGSGAAAAFPPLDQLFVGLRNVRRAGFDPFAPPADNMLL